MTNAPPAEAEAKDLASKRLAQLAARKAAKKAASAPAWVPRSCAGARRRCAMLPSFRSVLRERIERGVRPWMHSLSEA
jgi:hypothetical protein